MSRYGKQIGKRIRSARVAAGLTQREVAEALKLSHVGFGDIERGKNEPSLQYLEHLSRILGKPVTWFLGIETELADDEAELLHAYRSIEDEALRRLALKVVKEAAGIES
jgi:transcriptional regulator with XRE-family HTH domain